MSRQNYDINLEALGGSDGLIVNTHHRSSAGMGQEIEWARCMGVLYLSVDEASPSPCLARCDPSR